MIYWDLDGVLRYLAKVVWNKDPETWHCKTQDHLSIFDVIRMKPQLLIEAPETEYIGVAKKQKELLILSSQPEHWRTLTELWIATHLPDIHIDITFTENSLEKLQYLRQGDYLIEDYPLFPDYSKIILVDRRYNKNVNAPIRVSTPEQLERIINELKGVNIQV